MKKILSPIGYFFALIPIGIIIAMALGSVGFVLEYFHFYLLYQELILGAILILPLGIVLFWLTNAAIVKHEDLLHPDMFDHLRQSIIYYLIFIYGLYGFIWPSSRGGKLGTLDDVMAALALGSLLPIIINALFLYKLHRKNFDRL